MKEQEAQLLLSFLGSKTPFWWNLMFWWSHFLITDDWKCNARSPYFIFSFNTTFLESAFESYTKTNEKKLTKIGDSRCLCRNSNIFKK